MADLRGFAQGLSIGRDFSEPIANGLIRGAELQEAMRRRQFLETLQAAEFRQRQKEFEAQLARDEFGKAKFRTELSMSHGVGPISSFPSQPTLNFATRNIGDVITAPRAAIPLPGTGGLAFDRNAANQEALDLEGKKLAQKGAFLLDLERAKSMDEFRLNNAPYIVPGSEASRRGVFAAPEGIDTGLSPIPRSTDFLDTGARNKAAIEFEKAKRVPKQKLETIRNKQTGQKMVIGFESGDTIPEGWEIDHKPMNPDKPSTIRKELGDDDVIKSYRETNKQIGRLEQAMTEARSGKAESLVAVDQALITIFNKMLDPSSVVRESEYARTPADQSLLNALKGKLEKLNTGGAGLTSVEREAIYRMAKNFHNAQSGAAKALIEQYTAIARDAGYDPDLIIPADLRGSTGNGSPAPSGVTKSGIKFELAK